MSLLLVSWFVMAWTHEIGHLLGGWIGGATLVDYGLAPWQLPYSLHQPDPNPLLTLWAGPLFGVGFPICIALAARRRWVWFIADFCLVANGIYLAVAWVSSDPHLDTPRLLAAGTSPILIAAFCILTVGFGYPRFRQGCIALLHPTMTECEFRDAAK
jgi:hypothetical protein